MAFVYRIFGLTLGSAFPLPSLEPARIEAPDGPVEVQIVEGALPAPTSRIVVDEMTVQPCGEGDLLLDIPEAGRFLVERGERVVVAPAPGATPAQVHSYLLGSVMGVVLHQRGVLPLHGNGVVLNDTAFMFCGDSGAGKSTLAAFFQSRGLDLLTDDLCAVRLEAEGRAVVAAGIPRLKLWRDALDSLGQPRSEMTPVPWETEKFELRAGRPLSGVYRIGGVFHLREAGPDRPAGIATETGIGAMNVVTANIYRRRLADLAGCSAHYLAMTASVLKTTPVLSMNRQWGFEAFEAEGLAVIDTLRHLASVAPQPHTTCDCNHNLTEHH